MKPKNTLSTNMQVGRVTPCAPQHCQKAVARRGLTRPTIIRQAALLLLLALNLPLSTLAQGTAFTYQGRLNDGANPANGIYDLRFATYDLASGGSQAGPALTNFTTSVSNGLFIITLDFGANVFTNTDRFLEIAVQTNGAGSFTTLSPRQKLTPSPYAIFAENVGVGGLTAGTYGNAVTFNSPANNFSGSFNGNGAGVSNVNAATFGGLGSSNFWQTTGNAGTIAAAHFVGTTDNQPLEFRVNGVRALRLEDRSAPTNGAPNVIGGSPGNFTGAGTEAATIAGGGITNRFGAVEINRVLASYGTIGGGTDNSVGGGGATIAGGSHNAGNGGGSTISGGFNNTNNGSYSTIAGGRYNKCSAFLASLGGGEYNLCSAARATISGGQFNTNSGEAAVIGGGYFNISSGSYATVPGGSLNVASGDYSFAAGQQAKAIHPGTFVWADSQDTDFTSTSDDQFIIRAAGGVGINTNDPDGAALNVAGIARATAFEGNGSSLTTLNGNNVSTGTIADARLSANVALRAGGNTFNGQIRLNSTDGFSQSSIGNFAVDAPFIIGGRVMVLTNGNFGIGTNAPQQKLHVIGNILASGTITGSSDRNVKEHFSSVNPRDVLEKVAAMPITQWNYKADNETLRHIGPMAQDFYSAFNVGLDDKHISMVDADGVALAAIQGLNQKLEQKLEQKETEITELKQRLDTLEKIIRNQKPN